MKLPEIELDEIPGLPTKTAVFGSLNTNGGGGKSDDSAIIVMVFIYNNATNEGLGES